MLIRYDLHDVQVTEMLLDWLENMLSVKSIVCSTYLQKKF